MEYIYVDNSIRLRPFEASDIEHALIWYSDPVVLNGTISPYRTEPCSRDIIVAMYADLSYNSDFFIIEIHANSKWIPIGDVAVARNCMPIVIGDAQFRGKGLSKKIVIKLLERARQKGFSEINLKEIYKSNIASVKLFEGVGFKKTAETENGFSYKIIL